MDLSHSASIAVVDLSSFLNERRNTEILNSDSSLVTEDEIKLKSEQQRIAALELHKAFQDTGFAIVVNHGLEKEKVDLLRELSLKYFSYEISQKSSLANHNATIVSIITTILECY